MFVSDCLGLNALGHLTIGGRDTVELAQTYGTPLYVMDEDEIRRACESYRESVNRYYGGRGLVTYASKAFCCKAVCRIVAEEGLGLDVVSGGELYTAKSVGFPPERIFFHGNNKTVQELIEALEYGVGTIVVDNFDELMLLDQLAVSRGKVAEILFRIKPGIDAHTHDFVRTGQIDSKFGLALETGEAMEAVRQAVGMKGVRLKGVHCHIGSQIFDIEPFEHAAEVMLGFMADVKAETGRELEILDLGGRRGRRRRGLCPARYFHGDSRLRAVRYFLDTDRGRHHGGQPAERFFQKGRDKLPHRDRRGGRAGGADRAAAGTPAGAL